MELKKQKHVWILNHYAQEPGGPGGTRHFSLATYLEEFGWRASIIAASTELNTGRQRLSGDEQLRIEDFTGVPFCWVRTPSYEGNGGGRMKNMLTYCWRVLCDRGVGRLGAPDVIIGSSVHPFAAWAGARLAKRYGVPFVFEVRDLWPQTLIDLGRISQNGIPARLMRVLEKKLYRQAHAVVPLLPFAWKYIEPLGVAREQIRWLPNGVDLCQFPYSPPRSKPEPFTFMYFGAHGNANGLDTLLKALAVLEAESSAPGIRLRLIGNGPLKPDLIRLARDLSLRRITFEDPVSKNELPQVAATADAFVATLIDLPLYKYGISLNKIFDFLAAGRPVVFGSNSVNNPIDEAKAGITVAPGDPEAMAEAMRKVATMPLEERLELGRRGRAYLGNTHDYRVLAKRLGSILDEVVA